MIPPRRPDDEGERLARLRDLEVLDTGTEGSFENLTKLAAQLCDAPMALISLVDDQRQWFKAKVGIVDTETPREHSFCAHALEGTQAMIVADAQTDARFHDNPLVTGNPNVRFYAGVPLRVGEGSALGTLCVLDRVPRQLTESQLESLSLLADQVAVELRLRQQLQARREKLAAALGDDDGDGPVASDDQRGYDPDADLRLPVRIGARLADRYHLDGVLGHGGMGFVVAARDLRNQQPVAIKFLRSRPGNRREAVMRFAREARAVMRLESAHVVRILDVGNTDDGVPYIVMERLQGEELGAAIGRRGPLPVREAVRLLLQACEVLGEAHDAGIVHRDIKPSNLFLCASESGAPLLKVLDFGVAKVTTAAAPHAPRDLQSTSPDTQAVLGSPSYMSPEQMVGQADIDARADIWSLGVVMFEMLTGTVPFTGDSMSAVCGAVLSLPPPDPRRLRPDLPPAMVEVIARCLQKDRRERPDSMWAVAQALAPLA